jgi:uncharacterized protein
MSLKNPRWPWPQQTALQALASRGLLALRHAWLTQRFRLLFLLLLLVSCAPLNRYIFITKQELPATPVKFNLPYEEIWFLSQDGVPLNGWLVPGSDDKPLVLFFHGNAGNLSDNLDYLNLLHSSGLSVFIFDYRGYGKSEGKPRRENDLYQDARGALCYLEGEGWRREAMIFFGQSLGSAVAIQMALEAPPAGLVLESSFTSLHELVLQFTPFAYYLVGWWGIDLPFDNLAKIGRLRVPLLFIHGNQDTVVPVQMTQELFFHANAPKALHIESGGGHCDVFTRDSSAYLQAWSSYLLSIRAPLALKRP